MGSNRPAAVNLLGYDVTDSSGNKIGTIDDIWVDGATNRLEFIGVRTGTLLGKTHVVPIVKARISEQAIAVPYPEQQIKDSPDFPDDHEISPTEENEIYQYYGIERSVDLSPTGLAPGAESTVPDQGTARGPRRLTTGEVVEVPAELYGEETVIQT